MPINDEIYVLIPNNGLLDHTDRHFRISKGGSGAVQHGHDIHSAGAIGTTDFCCLVRHTAAN